MRSNMTGMLQQAQTAGRAIGSFNVYSFETIAGVLQAARAAEQPVILAFGERYLENMDFSTVAAIAEQLGSAGDVEYALHLDHCKDLGNVYRAMQAGFTSVMYDGSALPFEENVANSAAVVRVARALGISVEAELGSLASGDNSQESEDAEQQVYTDPDQAAEFVERTGVDALAVSIGTVHGTYRGKPNIRVDILRRIRSAVTVPLVLHGGSGTPPATITECIAAGICKINVNTEISTAAAARLQQALRDGSAPHLSVISSQLVGYVADAVGPYLQQFSN